MEANIGLLPAFDGEGNLWVGTHRKGIFRVRGNVVDQYGRTESLSGDFVRVLFEDRGGIVWAATNNGIDSFTIPGSPLFRLGGFGIGRSRGPSSQPEMAQSGSQMANPSITSSTVRSLPFALSMACRVIRSPPYWKIAQETCG